MAKDPVLQREMFNPRDRSAKGSGITSMVDDGSSAEMTREERMQVAQEMLAQAKMRQNPEYYFNTLAASDRPAMTRPVASSAPPPAMQPMPAAQQMAQMQAAGVRPVGMADGGEVRKGFAYGGIHNAVPRSSEDKTSGDGTLGFFNFLFPGITGEDVYTPPNSSEDPNRPNAPMLYGFPSEAARDAALNTPGELGTSLEKLAAADPSSGVSREEDAAEIKRFRARAGLSALANKSFVETQKEEPKEEPKETPADRKQTELEQIKADRKAEKERNFYLGLMQAGLAVAAGKSPDALQNIAQGGISGLQSYAGLEADSRKAEREDMAALRAQQQDDATAAYREATLGLEKKKMEQDPDMIRLYKALDPKGKGDVAAGYQVTQDDENLKAAVAVSRDTMASPEAKTAAEQYIMSKIASQPAFPGFSGTTLAP